MSQFTQRALPAPENGPGIDPLETALQESSAPAQGGGSSGGQKQNALAAVHRIFRGRYHWLIILGLILGGTGGYLGYRKGKQIYTCSGSIRINYYIPSFGGNSEQTGTGVQQGYDNFFNQQMQAITSKRVMEEAIKDPQWSGLVPFEDKDLAVMDLSRRIKVSQKGDQLMVEASDVNAAEVTAAVNAVVAAYRKLYVTVDPERGDPVMMGLRDTEKLLDADWRTVKSKLDAKVTEAGSDNLDADYASKHDQLAPDEAAIQKLKTQIAVAQLDLTKKPLQGVSDQKLMVLDQQLGVLSGALIQAESRVSRAAMASTSNPRDLHDATAALNDVKDQIKGRLAQIREYADAGIPIPGLALPTLHTKEDIAALQAQIDVLQPGVDQLRKELVAIGAKNIDLKNLNAQLADLDKKLAGTRETIEQRRVNNPMQRRIEVLSEGEFPLAPERDSRPKLAAAGGTAGFLFATIGVAMLGLMNTRLRAPHDLQIRLESQPVLGVIPSLDAGSDFQARAALASECVHRSRTMLEIWGRGTKKMVIGVTSPTHGSGNTSVAMSLGVSFAAAGLKTLLVDCDFVTTGLTPRLQTLVRREIGIVLQRTGLLTDVQLNHARRVHAGEETNAVIGQRSLGEVCVELNYITRAELDAALEVQKKESIGILDALQGEELLSCVGKTGIRNLSLLPRANATPAHAAKLCSQSLRQILDEAREHYDTVIIDTSAMLSGLEASIVASAVDGMVVTVKRGEERSKLQKTLARLKALECPVAGIIFNHVLPGDMPTPAPLDGASIDHDALLQDQLNLDLAGRLADLGPLASSVVSRVPVSDRGTELG